MDTLVQKLAQARTLGIWGYGLSGKSYLNFIARHFPHLQITIIDKTRPEDLSAPLGFIAQDDLAERAKSLDLIMPSPGIKPLSYHPYQEKLISELDLFGLFYRGKSIAITGSIGKTSTTSLITHVLKQNGIEASCAGNIGYPLLDLIDTPHNNPDHYAVIELSSAQLTLPHPHFHPTIAILTNIYPNHLDWHGSMDAYRAAKFSIFDSEQSMAHLVPEIEEAFSFVTPDSEPTFSRHTRKEDPHFVIPKNPVLTPPFDRIATSRENRFCAQTVCSLLGIQQPMCSHWQAPAHRVEFCGKLGQLDCYNDSKATIMESVHHAVDLLLDQYDHIELIMGGLSKGVDRSSSIQELLSKYGPKLTIHTFGKEAPVLAEIIRQQGHTCADYEDLEDVIEALKNWIPAYAGMTDDTKKPGAMLLSPGGSSFDLYKNYEERGNHFKELIAIYDSQSRASHDQD